MNKSELIDAISGSSGVGKGDVDSVLKALEEVVTSAVCGGGDKISLSGFLTFERTYRNPRTGTKPTNWGNHSDCWFKCDQGFRRFEAQKLLQRLQHRHSRNRFYM